MKFDVHRSNYPSSTLGLPLTTIEAPSHRAAQERAAELYRGVAVVVTPTPKPNAKLERARRSLTAGVTKRDSRHRGGPGR